jgi:signal transduction histidine kinase
MRSKTLSGSPKCSKSWNRFAAGLRSASQTVQSGRGRTVLSYVVSLLTVALATGLRLALVPVLGMHHPFTLYFAAVAITAWYGGFGPAVLAIMLSYVAADWFFITPRFELTFSRENLDELIALIAFVFSGLAIAITSKIMRQALDRARRKQAELEREIAERQRAEQALQQAQAQLLQHADLLEQRVQERTVHLQETIRSLEGVCYHIAHDLRAPLRAMEGFTDILLTDYAPGFDVTGESYLRRIGEAAHRMDLLIHGLLEYGRLGHEKFPLTRMNPRRPLERVLSSLSSEISSKRAEVNLGNWWPEIWGNEDLTELAFLHLISNALKFVRPGIPPRVNISAEDCQPLVRFWIEDNGIGIAPEHLHNAFKIFQRLHHRDLYPGTGIGLAITAKAIELMDGRIGVESQPATGSRFWFELNSPPLLPARQPSARVEREETFAFSL